MLHGCRHATLQIVNEWNAAVRVEFYSYPCQSATDLFPRNLFPFAIKFGQFAWLAVSKTIDDPFNRQEIHIRIVQCRLPDLAAFVAIASNPELVTHVALASLILN
jgi:hypothetical protein